ncbi:amidohydrolase family protein [Sphingomonas sp. OK281]|uniref:amidohydrolase family protein n=1 Tax=Sphingomonas sp. OK281 TaxID=1881067 RepID=UPI0008EE6339|nr:amidohydrolase family protein [Sphingomonas sp. OK281]SFO35929.1 Predicted amidohydrolase YtcJ [Sphingomonas sp. OK281]
MLIRGAELEGGRLADLRIENGRVVAIGQLSPAAGEASIDASGGLLLPGLHDHHIHVAALAAAAASVQCGPPHVTSLDALTAALTEASRRSDTGWLRGIGYHQSVAGMLDAGMLDTIAADRPIRIQHRGGRMWFLNSMALDLLLAGRSAPQGLERVDGRFTGRLFEGDVWLKTALAGRPPSFATIGTMLAARGVTGLTEISPANDSVIARHFAAERANGNLPQTVMLAGRSALCRDDMADGMTLGPVKLHLHEAALPAFDDIVHSIREAHDRGRTVAVHCVTEVELVFTLAAIDEAGAMRGDRIEHASIAPDTAVTEIVRLGLAVVSQPHFIAERGDAYRDSVAPEEQLLLYRLRALLDAGVTLAGGSDAPFGGADPWMSMAAAVSRQTHSGTTIGAGEALTPEQALDLYLAAPDDLRRRRHVEIGAPADLCLLDRRWARARDDLASVGVQATWIDGRRVHDRIDQPPA